MNTWTELIPLFNTWLTAAARTPSTIDTRNRWLTLLAKTYPQETPLTLTETHIQNWIATPHWKPASRKSALASVRRFYHYLEITGIREDNPTKLLLSVKVPRGKARPIATEKLHKTLTQAPTTEERLMILLAAYAGLRRFEIAKLHTSDITEGWMTIVGKGNVIRHIPIHPDLTPLIESKTTGYYFPGRFTGHRHPDYIGKRLTKLLPEHYTTHSLRHWFATTTYARCKDIRAVQELLGHADLATTQSYIGLQDHHLTAAIRSLTDLT